MILGGSMTPAVAKSSQPMAPASNSGLKGSWGANPKQRLKVPNCLHWL